MTFPLQFISKVTAFKLGPVSNNWVHNLFGSGFIYAKVEHCFNCLDILFLCVRLYETLKWRFHRFRSHKTSHDISRTSSSTVKWIHEENSKLAILYCILSMFCQYVLYIYVQVLWRQFSLKLWWFSNHCLAPISLILCWVCPLRIKSESMYISLLFPHYHWLVQLAIFTN